MMCFADKKGAGEFSQKPMRTLRIEFTKVASGKHEKKKFAADRSCNKQDLTPSLSLIQSAKLLFSQCIYFFFCFIDFILK